MKGFISNRENLVGLGAYSNTHSFFLFFSFFSCFSVSLSGAVFFIICSAWFRTYQCWTPVSKWLQMTAAKITTPGLKFEVEWTKEKLKNREEIHYNVSIFSFSKSYSGCCWIYLSHYAGPSSWKVQTAINFAPRSDNGKINSSPVTRSPPIVRFPGGCRQSFRIPVEDPDGDTVKCRFATYLESFKFNTSFPYGELDEVIESSSHH